MISEAWSTFEDKFYEAPQAEDGGVGLRLAWEMVHTYGPTAFIVPSFCSKTDQEIGSDW